MQLTDLQQKVAVLTGAGGGIGRHIARRLAEQGVRLVLCDIQEQHLKATEQTILAARGTAIAVRTDISNEADVAALFRKASSHYGRVDILINCAAIWDEGDIEQITGERLDRMIDINFKGTFMMCRAAIVLMRQQNNGTIVNIASTAGEYGSIRPAAHYAASKGAVIALSKSLAREGANARIRVNVVSPGPIDTPMLNITDERHKSLVGERTLLGRVGEPEDIATAVLFLSSSVSSWITGEVLRVNGGSLI
ncbi:SDR family NAD(P)-dependent oxidoreductase [Paenibacillus sp. GCM10027626]|uniref:SDR family NAD(P)-dependent oxidoreductase n=1 Tax=Paenibacillus sp. GCM10027626 TaxID=3273411 RepID=UPI003643F4CB